jgi:hypothetical protein
MSDDVNAKKVDTKKDDESKNELSKFSMDFSEYAEQFDENIFAGSEIRISRAALLQPGSPEIADEKPDYKFGMIVDNVTREVFTRELKSPWLKGDVPDAELTEHHSTLIVPCFKLPSEFIKWKNLQTEGRGWHFKTLERSDPRVREGIWPNAGGTWGEKEGETGAPPVTENCNYMCAVIDPLKKTILSDGIIFTFAKTSFRAGRDLTTYIRKGFKTNTPAFGYTYWCYTVKDKNDSGQKFCYMSVVPCTNTGKICPEAFDIGMDWHKKFTKKEDGLGKKLQYAYLSSAMLQDEDFNETYAENSRDTDSTDELGEDPF